MTPLKLKVPFETSARAREVSELLEVRQAGGSKERGLGV